MAGGRSFLQRLLRPFLPLVILAGLGLIYYLGVFSERTGFVREVLDPGLKRITLPVLNAFRGEDVPVDRLELLIPGPPWTAWPPSATVHWRPVCWTKARTAGTRRS